MQNIGAIGQVELPRGFTAGRSQRGAIGNSWRLSYHPGGDERVEITAYQRGLPLGDNDSLAFRALLAGEPNILIDEGSGSASEAEKKNLLSLGDTLGNAGNNQLVNDACGLRGPLFFLTAMELRSLHGRKVLQVQGRFHRSGMIVPPPPQAGSEGASQNDGTFFYQGIFIDGNAGVEQEDGPAPCQVEELLLQADTLSLFLDYQPQFETMLNSISWR